MQFSQYHPFLFNTLKIYHILNKIATKNAREGIFLFLVGLIIGWEKLTPNVSMRLTIEIMCKHCIFTLGGIFVTFTFNNANGKLYTLKKGDALFLPPGTVRSRLEGTEPCKYISFNFYALPEVEFPFSPL